VSSLDEGEKPHVQDGQGTLQGHDEQLNVSKCMSVSSMHMLGGGVDQGSAVTGHPLVNAHHVCIQQRHVVHPSKRALEHQGV
jgi:hypothetical protein